MTENYMILRKFLYLLLPASLLIATGYIYRHTGKKLATYRNSPPFMLRDFTNSHSLNPKSSVNHLLYDGPTFWFMEKEREGYELELELKLSHIYQNQQLIARKFTKLKISACPLTNYSFPKKLKLQFFTREAINVDKVLRLPEEKILQTMTIRAIQQDGVSVATDSFLQFQASERYPQNIFIVGIRLDILDVKREKICIHKIELLERRSDWN